MVLQRERETGMNPLHVTPAVYNVPSEVQLSLISNLPTCLECATDETKVGMWSCQSKGQGVGEITLRLRFLFFQTDWGLYNHRSFQNIEN